MNSSSSASLASNGVEVQGRPSQAAVTDLADISAKPHALLGVHGFLRLPAATFRLLFVFIVLHHERRLVPGPADQAFSAFTFSSMKFLKSMSMVMTSSIRKNTSSLRRLSRAIWFSPAIFANSIM